MKTNQRNEAAAVTPVGTAFKQACVGLCRKMLEQIARAKAAIFAESYDTLKSHEQLLRLALNEAEAAAWQTKFPYLVFPVLATEKVQAVAAWRQHQQTVRRGQGVPPGN